MGSTTSPSAKQEGEAPNPRTGPLVEPAQPQRSQKAPKPPKPRKVERRRRGRKG